MTSGHSEVNLVSTSGFTEDPDRTDRGDAAADLRRRRVESDRVSGERRHRDPVPLLQAAPVQTPQTAAAHPLQQVRALPALI